MVRVMIDPIPLILPCLNRFDMLTETLETVDTPIVPFIIDNWRGNRGVSGAWNLGMQRVLDAGYRYAIISNDDLKFSPGSLRAIYETLKETGAATVSPNQQREIRLFNKIDSRYENQGIRAGADFFCFAVDIEQLTQTAGWFDQNFFPAYFEDNDMHYRMNLSGLTGLIHTDYQVFHEVSMTQRFDSKNPVTTGEQFEAHSAYYDKKWGGLPTDETYTTPFNNLDLTVRDWNGSLVLDGLEESPAQDILDNIDSLCYAVPILGVRYQKF
jgi:hypothetical protein